MRTNPYRIPPGSDILPESNFYLRYLAFLFKNRFSHNVEEYRLFPCKNIPKSSSPLDIPVDGIMSPADILFYNNGRPCAEPIGPFMQRTDTTALLVIKDGHIVLEKYNNGYNQDSYFRVYSISKSFFSAMFGIALHENLFGSLDDSIMDYLPELCWGRSGKDITLRHLLLMNRGIVFHEGYMPWNENLRVYLHQDTKKTALESRLDHISEQFWYNDYHPVLLGIMLERVTGKSIADYLTEKIWQPMGAEFDAAFTCDSERRMFEKPESGLNMRAIDLARFGLLYLNKGHLNGKDIVPSPWIEESTSPSPHNMPGRYELYKHHPWGRLFFNKPGNQYKYFWWVSAIPGETPDYFAFGILGQVLYICPRKNAIAIRLGRGWNLHGWWPDVLKKYIERLP